MDNRERSFLILGTRADDFWQGMKLFSVTLWGTKILRAIFMGYQTIFLENILSEVIDQRLKKKLN